MSSNAAAPNTLLRYGSASEVTLDLRASARVTRCGCPPGEPLDDPAAAVGAALLDPLDFPPLSQCVVPGDRVTITLDPGLPQAPGLVAGVVDALLAAGVAPSDITLLRSIADADAEAADPREGLPERFAAEVALVTHDPQCRAELRYLAAARNGRPIYLNRRIHEAELVLPLGCLRFDTTPGYHGIHGGLFPTFSDTETMQRFHSISNDRLPERQRRRCDEVDEVGWLLGLSQTIQVVPAAGGQVLHILAGEVDAVLRRGRKLCEMAWSRSVPERADLIVAAIDGGPPQQTWDNVARALAAARRVVADGGTIALCTDLATEPPVALKRLAGARDSDSARRKLRKLHTSDVTVAAELLRAMDVAKVYFLSRLDSDVVEQLGMAPIADDRELARLTSHFDSCILLETAQYLVATPERE